MEASGDEAALMPKVAKLSEDMKSFENGVHDLVINDTDGKPIRADQHDRRFFEAAWYVKITRGRNCHDSSKSGGLTCAIGCTREDRSITSAIRRVCYLLPCLPTRLTLFLGDTHYIVYAMGDSPMGPVSQVSETDSFQS